jgi:hypothetical protein
VVLRRVASANTHNRDATLLQAPRRRKKREGLAALSALGVLSSPGGLCCCPNPSHYHPQLTARPRPPTSGCSTSNSAGARMCQASVTNSRSRVMSMASNQTITSGDQS